jgi:hypothetical protein
VPDERSPQSPGNAGVPPPLDALISKVVTSPAEVTDADFAAVGVCARHYEAGLAALAEAASTGEAG